MNTHDPHRSVADLLGHMIGFNTVNTGASNGAAPERPLAEALQKIARSWDLEAELLPAEGRDANLLVTARIAEQAPWLLCDSHMDTVAVGGMTVPPFDGMVKNGRMFGRGACDTKGSGATMLWALKEVHSSGKLANNTAILFTFGEEVGKHGVNAFVRDQLPLLDWRPSLVLVGEPTLLRPVLAHNGCVRWSIETFGVPAHSSHPEQGRSAITDMLRVVRMIEETYIPSLTASDPLTGRPRCSINTIHGGSQINVIAERCAIEIDRRTIPCEDPASVLPAVETLLQALREEDPGLQVRQNSPFIDPALPPLRQEEVLEWLSPVLRERGLPTAPEGRSYCTDGANHSTTGVPSVVIGPGDAAQAHTVDEWIDLQQLDAAVDVYGALFQKPLSFR